MIDLHFKYKTAVETIFKACPFVPDLAVVLGSGLGNFADTLETINIIPNESLPGYPTSKVPGHSSKIYFSKYMGKNILLFKGRIHFYEGNKLSECILPVFFSSKLGVKNILLTNAAGGVNPLFTPGDLMLAESFNAIFLKKELTALLGLGGINAKNNFNNFPSRELNEIILRAAQSKGITLHKGTYWFTKGPSYETPAEINLIKKYGGDAVGMSTVHEAVYAAWLGMRVSAISCITNYAAGISKNKLSHSEVTTTARLVEEKFGELIREIIKNPDR